MTTHGHQLGKEARTERASEVVWGSPPPQWEGETTAGKVRKRRRGPILRDKKRNIILDRQEASEEVLPSRQVAAMTGGENSQGWK